MESLRTRVASGKPLRVVVVGAGVSGLAAGYYAKKLAASAKVPIDLKLYEASDHVGGVIHTKTHEDFVLEQGPDCFISYKPEGVELARELGLDDQMIGTNPDIRQSFIVNNGKLQPVPQGFYLLSPVSLGALIKAPLFTMGGKLRMALELFISKRKEETDESLASFVRRRFGQEALERMAQPMVGGIYTADPEELSLAATFPIFLEHERKYGSVIRGLRYEAKRKQSATATASGPRYSLFVSFRDGMETLPRALAANLNNEIHLNTRVQSVARDQVTKTWNVTLGTGQRERADVLMLALPGWKSSQLLHNVDQEIASRLDDVPYASSLTMNLAFERSAIPELPAGMGFVVPAREGREILACSFSHNKFAGRAGDDKVLLRVFMGGALRPDLIELDEDELIARALNDLRDLLGIQTKPLFCQVWKHSRAMAQYTLGHVERAEGILQQASRHQGLLLLGNAFKGIGIPDCIREAKSAIAQLVQGLTSDS